MESKEITHECKFCKNRGKVWNGDNPKCAFKHDTFNSDNWNCATMSELRNIAAKNEKTCPIIRDDMNNGTICVIPIPDNLEIQGYLVMTWYKNRGETGSAIIVNDDEPPRVPTFKDAECIIEAYNKQ